MTLTCRNMDDFQKHIKTWVLLDNKIQEINHGLKELRDQRNDLGMQLYDYAHENDLESATIKISDGKLKFQNTKTMQPISLGLVESCLQDCLKDDTQVSSIMAYIKEARSVKMSRDVKRYYNSSKS